jgi:protein-S-isoprenylcysteine O-methyltransferase Ste14
MKEIPSDDKSGNECDWSAARIGMMRVAGATIGFAFWHSLLCSRAAKSGARKWLGQRRGAASYRVFFNAQSVVTVGALILFILHQPQRTLYRARGQKRMLHWCAQLGCLLLAIRGFFDLGPKQFSGAQDWQAGQENRALEAAEAQGPRLENDGRIRALGLFRWSRHPLEWLPILLLWLTPTLKTNWLAFDILGALYSFLGAHQEEKRLLEKSGASYEEYQKQTAFFVGLPKEQTE